MMSSSSKTNNDSEDKKSKIIKESSRNLGEKHELLTVLSILCCNSSLVINAQTNQEIVNNNVPAIMEFSGLDQNEWLHFEKKEVSTGDSLVEWLCFTKYIKDEDQEGLLHKKRKRKMGVIFRYSKLLG